MSIKADLRRSNTMRAIRSSGNKSTEIALIKLLKKHKITGWRRCYDVLGKPDFVWPKLQLAVFVDGCFWHGCKCRRPPKSNQSSWDTKILRNIKRDEAVSKALRKMGWSVLRVRECQLSKGRTICRIIRKLHERENSRSE